MSALDYERNDIETLAAASIASEEENDRRKAAERRAMEELQHSGDVMGSKMFIGVSPIKFHRTISIWPPRI